MSGRGAVPRNRGPVTTLLAGVSLAGMAPAMTVEGGTDTAVFATYLERVLLPTLIPGSSWWWTTSVRTSPSESASWSPPPAASWCSCPPTHQTCPRLREAFSKIKALVKAAAARTRAGLDAAIAAALAAVTAADVTGWFSHAGYLTRQAA